MMPTSLRLALRALRFHFFRSWLAAITIASAVAAIHVHYALTVRPAERAAELIERFQQQHLLVFDSFTTTLNISDLAEHDSALQKLGVQSRHDFLCAYFFLEPDPMPLMICGSNGPLPDEGGALVHVVDGEMNYQADEGLYTGMVSATLADRLGLSLGDTLRIFKNKPELQVTAIHERSVQVPMPDVFAPIEFVQMIKNRPGRLSFAMLKLGEGQEAASVAPEVEAVLHELQVMPASVAAGRLREGTRPLHVAAAALAMVIASLCGLIALFTLYAIVNERSADFAVMRAMGIKRQILLQQILWEGLIIGAGGAIKGVLIGETILIVIAPMLHPAIGGGSHLAELFLPFSIGLSAALLGALLPAWRAAESQPQSLLRS